MERRDLVKSILWDYNVQPEIFLEALIDAKTYKWITQEWALVRAIERLQYYDFIELVPFRLIIEKWPVIRKKIRMSHIRKGWDYVFRKFSVPSSG